MTTSERNILLKKFYDGQTTREEEYLLKDYFSENDVPDELRAEQEYFRAVAPRFSETPDIPEGLEQRISRSINLMENKRRNARLRIIRWSAAAAASVALVVSVSLLSNRQNDVKQYASEQDTYDNPKDAYAETARELTKFSTALNKGLNTVNKATK